ncbi:hypothetical protein T492DRAFT_916184 [Pavlovales sp. CCMP2436]|nr:hypothetical protein T492DRAFT_916184 [Pavlovales sp. CCMP2436]
MGEPRYNGAFTSKESTEDEGEGAEAMNSVAALNAAQSAFARFFPKRLHVPPYPFAPPASAADESEMEKMDYNSAGRHNGAFQMALDPRTEKRLEKMAGMHPITRFIAERMEDPVVCEAQLKEHFRQQEAQIALTRWSREQPIMFNDFGWTKKLRPVHDEQASVAARNNTYKLHIAQMEQRES